MIQIISLVKRVMVCVHVEHGFTCGWHAAPVAGGREPGCSA